MSIPTPPARSADPRRWKALGLLALADFLVVLDATIVNIALPAVGRRLHASTGSLSWVITAYILSFGGLLLLGGRLADLFGRRRLFVAGLVVFGLASLAAGLSTSIGELIVFRAVQGMGAAALAPAARSIVTVLFEEGAERSKAMGIWAAVAGSGSAVGLLLGGVLTSGFGWQWVFWVNVPVALVCALVTPTLISESRAEVDSRSVDYLGAGLVVSGLVAVLYALVNAHSAGWVSAQTIGLLSGGIALLGGFVWVESRVQVPLLRLSIFALPSLRAANIAMTLTGAAMVGLFFIFSLWEQQLQGYGALRAGMSQLPLAVVLIAVAAIAGPAAERLGTKRVLVSGLAVFSIGIAWFARLPLHGHFAADILGPSLIIAVGLALSFVALTIASTAGTAEAEAGIASGLINTTQQIGAAIGLAVITAVATSHTHAGSTPAAINNGFHTGLIVAVAIAAAATAAAAVVMPRRQSSPAGETDNTTVKTVDTPELAAA